MLRIMNMMGPRQQVYKMGWFSPDFDHQSPVFCVPDGGVAQRKSLVRSIHYIVSLNNRREKTVAALKNGGAEV